jgi:hypothetical protein
VRNDVWYSWTAPCTGAAAVSTLGRAEGVDTKIGVYVGGCAGDAIACNDNFDDTSMESDLLFPVSAGQVYLIQIGVSPNAPAPGSGAFSIDCSTRSCPADFNADGVVSSTDFRRAGRRPRRRPQHLHNVYQ